MIVYKNEKGHIVIDGEGQQVLCKKGEQAVKMGIGIDDLIVTNFIFNWGENLDENIYGFD